MFQLLSKEDVETMFANIKRRDAYTPVISAALSAGEIIRVNDDVYVLVKTKEGRLKWRADCVIHFPDKFVRRGIVNGHFRYIEHMTSKPKKYDGITERIIDFDIGKDNILEFSTPFSEL